MTLTAVRRDPLACAGAGLLGLCFGLIVAWQPLAGVLLVFGLLGTALVLARADLVLLAMIAALPWEAKLHYPSASLSTIKGIGLTVMAAYIVRILANRRTTVHLPPLLGIVTAMAVWIGVSMVVSPNPSECVEKTVRWMLFFAFFFLIVQLVNDRREIRRALRWFAASVAAAAVYALWGYFVNHDGSRLAGPLEDPNDFAYLLACSLPIVAYLISADRLRRPIWAACFVMISAAMLATLSRGALVGIGALLLWGIVTRRIPVWALLSGVVTIAIVVALAFTVWSPLLEKALHQKSHVAEKNVESRESFWAVAITLTERHPLTGVGPGRFPVEALPLLRNNPIYHEKPVTHNTYLEILSENGIPALALFFAYLATSWALLRGVQRRARANNDVDARRLATALQASFVIAIVSATFLSEELYAPFWLLGGLTVVLARDRVWASAVAKPEDRPTRDSHAGLMSPSPV